MIWSWKEALMSQKSRLTFRLFGLLLALIGSHLTRADAHTIVNTHFWTGVYPFGEPGAAYYQQTFVALPGKAQDLTIFLASNEGDTKFRVLIVEIRMT